MAKLVRVIQMWLSHCVIITITKTTTYPWLQPLNPINREWSPKKILGGMFIHMQRCATQPEMAEETHLSAAPEQEEDQDI